MAKFVYRKTIKILADLLKTYKKIFPFQFDILSINLTLAYPGREAFSI